MAATLALPHPWPSRMSKERVEWHLWNWERWMFRRGGIFRSMWYPGKASGGMGRSHCSDFDEMVEAIDRRCAKAVDAAIYDLPQPQRLAIHHKHLGSVYRVRCDLDTTYAEACVGVGRELAKRGIE